MTEPIWYYARGDSEQGPISTAQIKALAAAGALRRDDLVWKEGMENWLPARDVGELFPPDKKAKLASKIQATFKKDDDGEAETPEAPQPHTQPPASLTEIDVPQLVRWVGRALVIIGMLSVLMSRGCDSLGVRRVARLQALAESAENEFQREWQREKSQLEDEQRELREKESLSPAEQQRMQQIPGEIAELDRRKREEQRRFERGAWQRQKDLAEAADTENRMWRYWRQLGFLFGTMALALGLLCVTSTTDGPERWISLVMLAVVLYSVYSSNSVWDGTL